MNQWIPIPYLAVIALTVVLSINYSDAVSNSKNKGDVITASKKEDQLLKNIFYQSNGQFSKTVYSELSKGKGNLLISPLSLNYALTAISLGSAGQTESKFKDVLYHKHDANKIKETYRKYTSLLKEDKNTTVATKLFVNNRFQLLEGYANDLKNTFDAEIGKVNFANKKNSVDEINKYIDEKTKHLIPKFFSPDDITSSTQAILVNAVHFKAGWRYHFNESNTKKRTFHGIDKDYETDTMSLNDIELNFGRNTELGVDLLELPYKNEDYTFLIILPIKRDGIKDVENKIISLQSDSPFIDIFENQTFQVKIDLQLPKFYFEQTHRLSDILMKVGLDIAFGNKADFKKISNSYFKIDDVVQKTFIKVTEKSTEASAASVVRGGRSGPMEFIVDHPFLYVIRYNPTKTPLFIGRYSNP